MGMNKKQIVDRICSDLEIAESRINGMLDDFNISGFGDDLKKRDLELLKDYSNGIEGDAYLMEDYILWFEEEAEDKRLMKEEEKEERKVKKKARRKK